MNMTIRTADSRSRRSRLPARASRETGPLTVTSPLLCTAGADPGEHPTRDDHEGAGQSQPPAQTHLEEEVALGELVLEAVGGEVDVESSDRADRGQRHRHHAPARQQGIANDAADDDHGDEDPTVAERPGCLLRQVGPAQQPGQVRLEGVGREAGTLQHDPRQERRDHQQAQAREDNQRRRGAPHAGIRVPRAHRDDHRDAARSRSRAEPTKRQCARHGRDGTPRTVWHRGAGGLSRRRRPRGTSGSIHGGSRSPVPWLSSASAINPR